MKKITKTNLEGLRQLFPVLGKEEMRWHVGGNSDGYYGNDWLNHGYGGYDPDGNYHWYSGYTKDEFDNWEGPWYGGWVYGMGWVAPDANIYGHYYGNGSSGGYPWWYYDEPLERPDWGGNYGGYYNGYYGYGHYNGYGYWGGDSGSSGGGGTSGGNGDASGNSLTDGVNVDNARNFTFNTATHPVFNEQLTHLLRSNSVLKALLSYFDNGVIHMTFDIDTMNSIASTTYPLPDSFHIAFNEQFIDENGRNKILSHDNINYDWHKVHTPEEALVVVLAHEAQHANHVARFNDARFKTDNNPARTADLLKEWGYSQDFVNVFIEYEENTWSFVAGDQQVVNMHDYMDKYNDGVIDAALIEYRHDYNK